MLGKWIEVINTSPEGYQTAGGYNAGFYDNYVRWEGRYCVFDEENRSIYASLGGGKAVLFTVIELTGNMMYVTNPLSYFKKIQ
jgi:hypothetical protein